jgi:glycosyltransferase involved in cell wall biosynthesis
VEAGKTKMDNNWKVSIITVCYNSEAHIEKTMNSVLNQDYNHIEYIIIDGKSTDNTMKKVNSYESKFKKRGFDFIVLSEADGGIYDAMNKGVSLATGEIVGLINSDDWYETNAISCMVNTYKTNRFDMFYADLRIWRGSRTMIKKARFRKLVTTRDWNHPTTFITRETYKEFRYACKGIYDDWDLVLRIRNKGKKIVICNKVLANFSFGGVSNQKSIKKVCERIKEKFGIYRRNGYSRWYLMECILMETAKYFAA